MAARDDHDDVDVALSFVKYCRRAAKKARREAMSCPDFARWAVYVDEQEEASPTRDHHEPRRRGPLSYDEKVAQIVARIKHHEEHLDKWHAKLESLEKERAGNESESAESHVSPMHLHESVSEPSDGEEVEDDEEDGAEAAEAAPRADPSQYDMKLFNEAVERAKALRAKRLAAKQPVPTTINGKAVLCAKLKESECAYPCAWVKAHNDQNSKCRSGLKPPSARQPRKKGQRSSRGREQ